MLTMDKIYHASFVLREVARKTQLMAAPDLAPHCPLWLKTENLQATGSFKVRGAYYKISQLTCEQKARGVIASSAGNHAQGVALAAAKNHIPALICIPDSAPISKVEATRRLGAQVELVPGPYDESYARACQLQKEMGYELIHPFDDEDVIAGQGTIGLEILEQLPETDAVVVPIGGGGLISGIAYAVKQLRPQCLVYGVQAEGANAMERSFHAGALTPVNRVATFADGIAVKRPGSLTFSAVRSYVDDIVTVTEDETACAVLELMEKQKLITEGAGAVAAAAVMFGKLRLEGKRTVCVLSGGNIDVNILSRVITRGLLMAGRISNLTIALIDKPGQLEEVSGIIAGLGGNVVSVQYDRSDANMAINSCYLKIGMETRDHSQVRAIRQALRERGFELAE